MREIDTYLSAVTRQFRTVRGVWRLSERLRHRFVGRYAAKSNPWVVIDDFEGDLRLRVDRSSMIGSLIYWNGSFSPNELAVLRRILEPDMVFVDVGANQGELTVFAASRLPRGHVLAFEPLQSLHRQLLENIALNGFQNVTAQRMALSDRPGRMALYVDRGTTEGFNEGTASFFSGGTRTSAEEVVEVATFDDMFERSGLRRLDVIKIDVEGAELFVLRGAERSLTHYHPSIILEIAEGNFAAAGYGTKDLLRFLADHRYTLSLIGGRGQLLGLDPGRSSDVPAYCNVLCTPA